MIRYFHGNEIERFPDDADKMFRLRAKQFRDRLKWNVQVSDGWEIDEYDKMNPLYLVSKEENSGAVVGCLRYLPTTGPTMMKGVFDQYFDRPFDIESPLVWECTRFAIEPTISSSRLTPTRLCRTTFELMQGGCEVALQAGVSQVVGIFDQHMIRIYRRTGFSPEVIASSNRLETGTIYIGIWDISEKALAALRERSGLTGSVLLDEGTSRLVDAVA